MPKLAQTPGASAIPASGTLSPTVGASGVWGVAGNLPFPQAGAGLGDHAREAHCGQ